MAHLLLGIWSQEESAGRKVLSALGFNDEKAKEIAKTSVSFKFYHIIIYATRILTVTPNTTLTPVII